MSPVYDFAAGVFFSLLSLGILYRALTMPNLGPAQRDIIHFICSFCAGAAGAFFTGSALLSFDAQIGTGGKLAFQGTAGVALFALVFLIFRLRYREAPLTVNGSWIAPSGKNPFTQIANAIAAEVGATIDLSALTDEEKKLCPSGDQLDASTVELAKASLLRLREMVPPGTIRNYQVTYDAATKRFKILT